MRPGKRRKAKLAGAILAGPLLLAGLGEAADLPEIQARGTLRVLAVASPEETFFISEEPRGGFDWELLEGFARLQRLRLELVTVSGWDELIPALARGRGDLIAGGFTDTQARRRQIAFTLEVFPTRSVVVTRKPNPAVTTPAELKAARIGTLKGSFMYDDLLAAGIPAARIDDGLPAGGIPEALRAGRITAGVDGSEAALIAKRKDPELEIGLFLGKPASLAWGVGLGDTRLRGALDEYVGNVRHTPTWSRLAVKYFGDSAPEILRKARGEQ